MREYFLENKDISYNYDVGGKTKTIIENILIKETHIEWRYVNPDLIPPLPARTFVVKDNKLNNGIGLFIKNKKSTIGLVSLRKENFGNLELGKNKKQINGDYYLLTYNRNQNIEKKKDSISRSIFLINIKKYLKDSDRKLIERVSKSSFTKLIKELQKLDSKRFTEVASSDRWVNLPKLNRMGLHILRCILAERVFDKKISKYLSNEDVKTIHQNGYLVKEFSKVNNSKLNTILNSLSNSKSKGKLKFRRISFKHVKNDTQYEMHIDSFHNTFKIWGYPGSTLKKNGPLRFIPSSHKLTEEKLKWLYEKSNSKVALSEPSFRISKKDEKIFGNVKQVLPINKRKIIMIANTFMFHCRGKAKPGEKRITYRLEGNNDGGLKRVSPFI